MTLTGAELDALLALLAHTLRNDPRPDLDSLDALAEVEQKILEAFHVHIEVPQ